MRILIFDSGLGGLTVFRPVAEILPDAQITYIADNAGFPYGRWPEKALVERIVSLMGVLIEKIEPDIIVIACNTASTAALETLRAQYSVPIVGTVPAIKVAAQTSKSRCFSVLATPATVKREYTRALVALHAPDCRVKLVGARGLAGLAEAKIRGVEIELPHVATIIKPAFIDDDNRRTDTIVLACTHFPLLLDELEKAASWPVQFIDPAPAIAKQVQRVIGGEGARRQGRVPPSVIFTANVAPAKNLLKYLEDSGFEILPRLLPGWQRDKRFDGISG